MQPCARPVILQSSVLQVTADCDDGTPGSTASVYMDYHSAPSENRVDYCLPAESFTMKSLDEGLCISPSGPKMLPDPVARMADVEQVSYFQQRGESML